jgi:hypothetical protein
MPPPIIIAHIAKRGRNTALRRNRMRAGWKDFGNTRRFQTALGAAQSRPQAGPTGADNDNVKLMIGKRMRTHFYLLY